MRILEGFYHLGPLEVFVPDSCLVESREFRGLSGRKVTMRIPTKMDTIPQTRNII
jgi:hypothetical protein